jgi:ubiquinone/menaquinone biosynthesis C-methylase UbiE
MDRKRSILELWKDYIKKTHPLVKEWLNKENDYLEKNIKKGAIVLDVGCGFGRNIKAIYRVAKKIAGIDNDRLFCEDIRKKLARFKNVEFFCEDARKMHFLSNTFDYVICMGNTFGNFGKYKLKILKEMKRVAKKGGKIVVSVYKDSSETLNIRVREYKKQGIKIKIRNGAVYNIEDKIVSEQFNEKKIRRIFSSAGLRVKIIELNSISYLCEAVK